MIIQTGMRTDIPAFYAPWFANRLREGTVCVRNPYDPFSVTRYRLHPEVVDLILFCTKNPAPMFPYMELLKPYGQYWFVTITPYGRDVEPAVPPAEKVTEDFRRLSAMVGRERIAWRYDPVFVTDIYSVERHMLEFEKMAAALAGYTSVCVFSFLDLYRKVKKNFPEGRRVQPEERRRLAAAFGETGRRYGMTVKACGEGKDLEKYGIDCSGCMTVETYEKALGFDLDVPRQKPARKECACFMGNDIGAYDSCGHLCRYCYANTDGETVRRNRREHDPYSPFLLGHGRKEDRVHDAEQRSWADRQLKLF